MKDDFEKMHVQIVAVSTDPEEKARNLGLGSITHVENGVVDVHSDLPDHRINGAVAIAA